MNSDVNLNIGSKVRIKSKKWYESMKSKNGAISNDKVPLGFNEKMAMHCGKIATIIEDGKIRIFDGKTIKYYIIDLDQSRWKWTDAMFDTTHKGIEIE